MASWVSVARLGKPRTRVLGPDFAAIMRYTQHFLYFIVEEGHGDYGTGAMILPGTGPV